MVYYMKSNGDYSIREVSIKQVSIGGIEGVVTVFMTHPIYFLDTATSEGDTTTMLHRELARVGIQARGGIITAVARGHYHVRQSDLYRIHKFYSPNGSSVRRHWIAFTSRVSSAQG